MRRLQNAEELAAATRTGTIAVLLHATWCPFCRVVVPVFAAACAERELTAAELLLDDEANPLWREYAVNVVPTVLLFAGGAQVGRLDARLGVGLAEAQLVAALDAFAARPA